MNPVRHRGATLGLVLVIVVAALVGVGCWYRGYLAGMLPSAAAEIGDISAAARLPHRRLRRRRAQRAADGARAHRRRLRRLARPRARCTRWWIGTATIGPTRSTCWPAGSNMPSGVAFRDGALYVAEVSRILRFRDVARDLARRPKPEVVSDAFPSDAHHGWKFIAFGPDGRLYVPVGAPCNVCEPPGPLHATITRLDLDGGRPEVVARGVRNSRRLRLPSARPASCGSPTTAATGWATISRRTS